MYANPLTTDATKVIVDLYKIFPMLNEILCSVDWKETDDAKDIQHMMDINEAGRVLLQRFPDATSRVEPPQKRKMALSVWPHVLARTARKIRTKQPKYAINPSRDRNAANGLYHLIRHGPIFASKVEWSASQQATRSATATTPRKEGMKKRKADAALGGFGSAEEYLNTFHGKN